MWLDDLVAHCAERLDAEAEDALLARGVVLDQARHFGIGVTGKVLPEGIAYPDAFTRWWAHRAATEGRVFVLPCTTVLGRVGGIQLRHIDQAVPGYMDYFEEKGEPSLFGLTQAMPHVWETGKIMLVEGAFDLLPIQRTIPWVVATLTARVSQGFFRTLARLVDHVWIGYDADSAGQGAARRFAEQHGDRFGVRVVSYPKVQMFREGAWTKDPSDLWLVWGEDKFKDYLSSLLVTES